jgi:hypothetical protein
MKDVEVIDWREGFPQLPLNKENKLKEGSWKVLRRIFFGILCFFLGGGGELVIFCEEIFFMEKNVCKQKSMEGSCV